MFHIPSLTLTARPLNINGLEDDTPIWHNPSKSRNYFWNGLDWGTRARPFWASKSAETNRDFETSQCRKSAIHKIIADYDFEKFLLGVIEIPLKNTSNLNPRLTLSFGFLWTFNICPQHLPLISPSDSCGGLVTFAERPVKLGMLGMSWRVPKRWIIFKSAPFSKGASKKNSWRSFSCCQEMGVTS